MTIGIKAMECINRSVTMMPNSKQSPEKRSSLQTIAICTKLEQGVPEIEIRRLVDSNNEYASDFLKFYIDFALENICFHV